MPRAAPLQGAPAASLLAGLAVTALEQAVCALRVLSFVRRRSGSYEYMAGQALHAKALPLRSTMLSVMIESIRVPFHAIALNLDSAVDRSLSSGEPHEHSLLFVR